MNPSIIFDALSLPPSARIDRRVPKSLLVEHGAPTTADKRQIAAGIEELLWVAALKPNTIGIPAYQDASREYLEIAVLSLLLRPEAKAARLIELVHRAVPYPVFLVTSQPPTLALSLAHKRWSQGEVGKTVLEDKPIEVTLADHPADSAFIAMLALNRQPRTSLYAVYQAWIDSVTGLLVAHTTGAFVQPRSPDSAAALRDGLAELARLERDIKQLRVQAERETQINRRVELNLEIKRLEAEFTRVKHSLGDEANENIDHP